MKFLVSLVAMILLGSVAGCAGPMPTPALAPTVTTAISRERAIETATGECKIPHLVLLGEPQNIRAQLMTLQEADRLTNQEGSQNFYDITMDSSVWLVQMDGMLQLVGGPLPIDPTSHLPVTPTPSTPAWGTCKVIINADTGRTILISG